MSDQPDGPGSRLTRANSVDSKLYTTKDLEQLLKKNRQQKIDEEEKFYSPLKLNSPNLIRAGNAPPGETPLQTENATPTAAYTETATTSAASTENTNISTEPPSSPPANDQRRQSNTNSSNMAIVYKDIKDLIPKYNGERKGLDEFIQTIDALASQLTEDRDKKLFNLSVKTHLKDKAFNTIRHLQNPTWEVIKQALKDKLNPLDATSCYNALTHAKQTNNESITDFAMKVETLLTNLNRSSTIEASEATRKYVQDSNEQLAKRAFENGILNFQLKTLIIAKNKKTLEEAIREALDMDSSGEYRNTDTRKGKNCNFCKKKGHLENDCYKKNATKEENPETEKTDKTCTFCKRKGHTIQECRTKARSNSSNYRNQDAKTHVVTTTESDNEEDDTVTVEDLESNHLN